VRAYELSVCGFSNLAIAATLKCDRKTVTRDIAMEGQRRALESAGDREQLIGRSVAFYDKLISDSFLRIAEIRAAIAAATRERTKIELRHLVRLEVDGIRKSKRQSEEVQGLHVALSIDASTTNNFTLAVGSALAAFGAVESETRALMRRQGRNDRKADAAAQALAERAEDALKDVTPQP